MKQVVNFGLSFRSPLLTDGFGCRSNQTLGTASSEIGIPPIEWGIQKGKAMVRLSEYEEAEREHLINLPCPTYSTSPYVGGLKLSQTRIALISTAGLHRRGDRPFGVGESGYRLIPKEVQSQDLVMSHISSNFDRTGFQMDQNLVFPLDRLRELEQDGGIGSLAEYHYSFMGATPPDQMRQEATHLAEILKKDRVDAVFLVPV